MPTPSQLWFDPVLLDWPVEGTGASSSMQETWRRPYEWLAHADLRLRETPDDMGRTDAISALKRAVDHRVRDLHAKYDLRRLPIRDKPKDRIEVLQWVGLIRPTMLQKLIEIRNAIEHDDARPPDAETCRVFA